MLVKILVESDSWGKKNIVFKKKKKQTDGMESNSKPF